MNFVATIVFLQCSLGGVEIPRIDRSVGGGSLYNITHHINTVKEELNVANCKEINIKIKGEYLDE